MNKLSTFQYYYQWYNLYLRNVYYCQNQPINLSSLGMDIWAMNRYCRYQFKKLSLEE